MIDREAFGNAIVQYLNADAGHEESLDAAITAYLTALASQEGAQAGEVAAWHKAHHRSVMASVKLGSWMSAALEDPNVCDEMKADINEWFSAGEPFEAYVLAMTAEHPAFVRPLPSLPEAPSKKGED